MRVIEQDLHITKTSGTSVQCTQTNPEILLGQMKRRLPILQKNKPLSRIITKLH